MKNNINLLNIIENFTSETNSTSSTECSFLTQEEENKLKQYMDSLYELKDVFKQDKIFTDKIKMFEEVTDLVEKKSLSECVDFIEEKMIKDHFSYTRKKLKELKNVFQECASKLKNAELLYEDFLYLMERYYTHNNQDETDNNIEDDTKVKTNDDVF